MSDTNTPNDEIIEEIEIKIDDDDIAGLKADEKSKGPDLAEEFRSFGRQFAQTVEAAWNSEERVRIEQEIREGVNSFVNEVDAVIREAKDGERAKKLADNAVGMKDRAESSDLGLKARESIAQGLSWLSDEFGKLADQFTQAEKSPEDIDDSPDDIKSGDQA